jgi:hypothetical protein
MRVLTTHRSVHVRLKILHKRPGAVPVPLRSCMCVCAAALWRPRGLHDIQARAAGVQRCGPCARRTGRGGGRRSRIAAQMRPSASVTSAGQCAARPPASHERQRQAPIRCFACDQVPSVEGAYSTGQSRREGGGGFRGFGCPGLYGLTPVACVLRLSAASRPSLTCRRLSRSCGAKAISSVPTATRLPRNGRASRSLRAAVSEDAGRFVCNWI